MKGAWNLSVLSLPCDSVNKRDKKVDDIRNSFVCIHLKLQKL